jgi:hypothetical protein
VILVKDLLNRANVWGSGIILARRIMDIGKDGHILVTDKTGEELREFTDAYKEMIHPVDYYTFKHGKRMLVYSVHGDGFGNPEKPKKQYELDEIRCHVLKDYQTIDDKHPDLVHHKTYYEIQILTDSELLSFDMKVSFDNPTKLTECKIAAVDKSNNKLDIVMNSNHPMSKRFSVKFMRPIEIGERTQFYFTYDAVDTTRTSGIAIMKDVSYLEVILEYPNSIAGIAPKLIECDTEWNRIAEIYLPTKIAQDNKHTIVTWSKWTPSWDKVLVTW